jgi:hypothetical protein
MSYETNRLPLNWNDIPCVSLNHTTTENSSLKRALKELTSKGESVIRSLCA